MGAAISLVANNDSQNHIIGLWNKASEFEDTPSMQSLDYPPHFTFAIYQDTDAVSFRKAVRQVFSQTRQVRIVFNEIRCFDASPLVLWASPEDNRQLHHLHAALHAEINPQLCSELYRPQQWIAHCTLATRIQEARRSDALSFASTPFEPFEVIFDTIDLIEFTPIEIVARIALES